MKIILIAYACEPGKGSEPRLGWLWVKHLSRKHRVYVITRVSNKYAIEKELSNNPIPNLNFLYFDLPKPLLFWKRGRIGVQIYHYLWQIGIFIKFGYLIKRRNFDIVHHVTFGHNWQPVFLSLVAKNFIWGPIGSEDTPKIILKQLPFKYKIKEHLRELGRFILLNFDPFVQLTARKAKVILDSSSRWTKKYYHKDIQAKIIKFPQNGIDPEELPLTPKEILEKKDYKTFNIVFVGEFVPWKGILFVVDTIKKFAEFAGDDWKAILVGYGPEFENVKRELYYLGKKVALTGKINNNEVWNILINGNVFLYPSFHHGQATVLMHALACGLPVICIEGDATAETITSDCGIVVKLGDKEEIVKGLTEALLTLYKDRELLKKLSKNAQELVFREYSWEKKVDFVTKIYYNLLNNIEK